MRTVLRSRILLGPLLILTFYGFMPGCAHMALSDEMNLRAKFVDFSKQEDQKRWMVEDQITMKERAFQDSIKAYMRDSELKAQDAVLQAPDWKQAKRDYRDKTRNLTYEVRQRIRVHREQFELEWISVQRDQEKDMRDFLDPMEAEFKKNRQNPAYEKAQSDFEAGREDVRDEYSKWKEHIRELKTTDSYLLN
jgi:hypothetical protein